jgi:MFS family permease
LTVCHNAFFVSGNWIFFWLRYMNYGQIGIIDACCFAFGMLMEVPTGAIADILGKKRTLVVASVLAGLGFMVMGSSTGVAQLWIGFLISQMGWAFYSGAAEAMAYDSLVEAGQESIFDQVTSTASSLGTLTVIVATLLGTGLYEWQFRLPHLALGAIYLIGAVLAWQVHEPKVDTQHFTWSGYWHQLQQGFRVLRGPTLRSLLPIMLALLGMYYLFIYGFVKPAVSQSFGWGAREQGLVYAGVNLLAAVVTRAIPWLRTHLNDLQGLAMLTTFLAAGFGLSVAVGGWWGILPFVLITIGGQLGNPWVSVVVNRDIPSEYRATTLSSLALLSKVPYVVAAIVAGQMIEAGQLSILMVWLALITFLMMGLSAGWWWWGHQQRSL